MTEVKTHSKGSDTLSGHVPVIIIGAGPAGMSAAAECARYGVRCLVLDEQDSMGGQIYRSITKTDAQRQSILGEDYSAGAAIAQAAHHSLIDYRPGSTVWQVTREREVSFKSKGQSHTVSADHIILATGAQERPFPVKGWTTPGVLTAGGGQILLKAAGVVPSGNVVLAGCGPLLYLLAHQYIRAGVSIRAIVDTSRRADIKAALPHLFPALRAFEYLRKGLGMINAIKKAKIPIHRGASRLQISGTESVEAIHFESVGRSHTIKADVVFLHQGVIPNNQISWSLRAEHRWDERQQCWHPVTTEWGELDVPGIYVAGDGAGIGGAVVAALQGRLTALEVCQRSGALEIAQRDQLAGPVRNDLERNLRIRPFLDALYEPKLENRVPQGETLVCRCEGVTAADIESYVDHGCVGPNQAKAFGRCGMGPCQGRQCGPTVTELIASRLKAAPDDVGYYRIRPPIKPLTVGELAGNALHTTGAQDTTQ